MSCTFNETLILTGVCSQWPSKDAYSSMALGGVTKFKMLYADFRSDVTSVANLDNLAHEGSVRPPSLK